LNQKAFERFGLVPAQRLRDATEASPAQWQSSALAGRLAELSGAGATASLTLAFSLVLDAQREGEPVAWITATDSIFFPPDAAEGGVDLDALVVVLVPELRQAFRATDHLARSGAFGLLILDLGSRARMPTPVQTRLAGLATRHGTLILCLTEKRGTEPSLGSLCSLRGEATRVRRGDNRFSCQVQVLKDKRRGPGWTHTELCRGPDGLR
jgi:recombination protein RecA